MPYEDDSQDAGGSGASDQDGETSAATQSADSAEADIRRSIVDLALSFVNDKAHYLWGTAGNVPGQRNGNEGGGKIDSAKLRPYSLNKTATDQNRAIGVCLAAQSIFGGYNSCAGRCKIIEADNTFYDSDLDKYVTDREVDVRQGTPQTQWEGITDVEGRWIHPRRVHFQGALSFGGKVVWGESCHGVRHFDCVGLVNYCYARHYNGKSFGIDIAAFRGPNSGFERRSSTSTSDFKNGDVIITRSNSHIAMIYESGGSWYIVQALSSESGLTKDSSFQPGDWDRFRLPAVYLVPRHD